MQIKDWDGGMITEPGIYRGIPIEVYHNDVNLLPGPSVSKSALKLIAPPYGTPKQFWRYWRQNPDRVVKTPSDEMIFGKAVHALLLGDEVFDERFIIRPERVEGESYQGNKTVWKNWYRKQAERGLNVLSSEQIELIRLMAADAAKHPLVQAGGLRGEVELSMIARDPQTGIWVMSRPDVRPDDGVFVDLKTASSLEPPFLIRQFEEAGYYLQAALTKYVCDLLRLPFESFTFLYTLTKDGPDTDYRVASEQDILIGIDVIHRSLRLIRECLNTGEWQGMSIYARENRPLAMPNETRTQIINQLRMEGFSV